MTSLIEHFVMAAMQDDALKALISDLGEGIVIDPELLEGCSVAAHDLDDMDAAQAAEVAAHVFFTLFETKVLEQTGDGPYFGSARGCAIKHIMKYIVGYA